jgi:hypothetical protein
MSSTLHFMKTPRPEEELGSCKVPLKSIFARKYYDHDGSCGGGLMTLGVVDLEWLKGVRDAGSIQGDQMRLLRDIITLIEEGETVDMWFSV